MDYFTSRRSVRRFRAEDVAASLLDSILSRAMKAPTCGNMQLYTVIVNRDPEMLKQLAPAHFNQPAATSCPVMVTVCADYDRFTRWCRLNGADAGFDNFLSFLTAMTDATILAQQITTIAEMEGLGTCWLGTVTYNAPMISRILDLPELTVPVACLAIGWPDGDGEPTERLELETVVHRERYRRDSDEEIQRQFAIKDNYPPNRGYAAENGKENLAQVFAEVRYPRAMNEEFSEIFLKLLREKSFLK